MIQLIFEYTTLRLIWWVLLGVLLIGFAVTDGFDMGVGALLPFVAKTDTERRVAINTVGPVWEGNQVWFILGGGAIFAAWPALYALSFSGFYLAMFLVLFALILRPVGFKYRSKRESIAWRRNWDWALFVGGAVPALIFGVAVGNALEGVPFHFTDDLRPIYEGNLFGLLNPLALYCGLVSLSMLVMHGAAWLAFKAEGPVADRAAAFGARAALVTAVLFAGGGVLIWLGAFGGYQVTSPIVWDGPSNPLGKAVAVEFGRLAEEFPRHAVAGGRAAAWHRRAAACRRRLRRAPGRPDPARLQARDRLHHRHCRPVDVSGHPAVEYQPEQFAYRVRRLVEPGYPSQHADRHRDPAADRAGLHGLGLQGAVGQSQPGHDREGRLVGLLSSEKRRQTMWYFAWILGLGLAATVGILNALWYELRTVRERDAVSTPALPTP